MHRDVIEHRIAQVLTKAGNRTRREVRVELDSVDATVVAEDALGGISRTYGKAMLVVMQNGPIGIASTVGYEVFPSTTAVKRVHDIDFTEIKDVGGANSGPFCAAFKMVVVATLRKVGVNGWTLGQVRADVSPS